MRQTGLIVILVLCLSTFAGAEETRQFPLGNKILREKGIELPLPFGVSVLFGRFMDDTKITEIQLPLFGDITGSKTSKSESETDAYNLRADLWLLPFMNVYFIGGYLDGKSSATIDLSDFLSTPTPTPTPATSFEFDIEQSYHGTTLGIGTTLVYGVDSWVASVDINYTQTELDVVDGNIKNVMITPRIGYSMLRHGFPVIIGLGVSYLDIQRRLTAKIDAPRARQDITAKIEIENENNWNAVLTTFFELTKHWHLVAEVGFYDRKSFATQLTYRF